MHNTNLLRFAVFNFFILIISSNSTAKEEMLRCPRSNPQYSELISRLEKFKDRLEADPSCSELNKHLASFSTSIQRGVPFGIERTDNSELSMYELSQLDNYSKSIVNKVQAVLNEMLLKPQCMNENKVSVLQVLSSVTQEVTSIGASFSGPYGVPISIGGAAVSGILSSIDLLIKKSGNGYDFKKSEYRDLFATNLCIYHDVKQEVLDLLHPEFRMTAYKTLYSELGLGQKELISKYPLCKDYQEVYDNFNLAFPTVDKIKKAFLSLDPLETNQDVWNTCTSISKLVHSPTSDLASMINELPGSSLIDFSPTRVLFEYAKSAKGIIQPENCWDKNRDTLLESNLRAKNLVSQIIDGALDTYKLKLNELFSISKIKFGEDHPVEWLRDSIEKKNWAEKERLNIDGLINNQSYQARTELSRTKEFFDQRLFKELAPNFISWYIKDVNTKMKKYLKDRKSVQSRISKKHFNVTFMKKSLTLSEIISQAKERPKDRELHYDLYSSIETLLSPSSGIFLGKFTIDQFRNYLSKSGSSSKELIKLWDKYSFHKISAFIEQEKEEIESFIKYLNWCHENGLIKADSLKVMIERIKECRKNIINSN